MYFRAEFFAPYGLFKGSVAAILMHGATVAANFMILAEKPGSAVLRSLEFGVFLPRMRKRWERKVEAGRNTAPIRDECMIFRHQTMPVVLSCRPCYIPTPTVSMNGAPQSDVGSYKGNHVMGRARADDLQPQPAQFGPLSLNGHTCAALMLRSSATLAAAFTAQVKPIHLHMARKAFASFRGRTSAQLLQPAPCRIAAS